MRYQLWVVLVAMLFCMTTAKAADNGTVMIKEASADALTHAIIKVNGTEVTVGGTTTATGTVTLLIEDKSDEDYLLTDASVAIKTYTTETAQGRTRSGATPNYLGTITATPDANQKGKYTFAMPDNSLNVEVTINVTAKQVALTGVPATYTGSAITPGVQIGGVTAGSGDFSMECANNIDAGTNTASATITGTGNYWGTVTKAFTINKAELVSASFATGKQSMTYTGSELTTEIATVMAEGGIVVPAAAYTITGTTSATTADTYTLTISANEESNFKSPATPLSLNWVILAAGIDNIDRFDIAISNGPFYYDGTAKTPTVTVIDNHDPSNPTTLTLGTDYTVGGHTNNTEVGTNTASVTVTGTGNYGGLRTITYSIGKAQVTVTPEAHAITYGDAPAHNGVTYTGFIGGDDASVITGAPSYSYSYSQYGDAGTYDITVNTDGMSATRYDFVAGDGTGKLTVNKATLNVSANDNTITYGDAPAGNGVTCEGFKGTDTQSVVSGTPTYTYTYNQYDNVGTYKITYNTGLTATNYDFAAVAESGTLTVNQKEVGLSWSTDALTYDGNPQAPTATATGTVNNDEITVTVTGQETNAGTGYTATASALTGSKAGNYKLPAANTTTFNIGKAAGSVNFSEASLSKIFTDATFLCNDPAYDSSNPVSNKLTVVGDGEVSYSATPETVATVIAATGQGTIIGNGTAVITATVTDKDGGNYTYGTAGSATANFTLNVGVATMTVSAPAYEGTFDGAAHGITVTVTDPVDLGPTIKYSLTAPADPLDSDSYSLTTNPTFTDAGTYTVYYHVSKPNYGTVAGSQTVTINKKALKITAKPQTVTYGTAITTGTDQVTIDDTDGLVDGDALTAITLTPSTTDVTTTGTITPSAATTTKGIDNYTVTYQTGALTINTNDTAPTVNVSNITTGGTPTVTVKVGNTTLVAGTDYTVTYKNSNNTEVTPPFNTAGTYTVEVKAKAGGNYGFADVTKTFTVSNPAPTVYYYSIDVTQPEHGTVSMDNNETYGAAGYTYNVTATADEGYYVESITVNGTAIEGNSFTMPYESVTVSAIIKAKTNIADATVTLDWTQKTYNGQTQKAVVSSVAVGETTLTESDYTVTYTEEAWKNAGEYTITVAAADGKNTIMGSKTATFTIAKAELTVTADDKTMEMGDELPTLTVSYDGFVNSETENVLTTKPTASTTATKDSEAGTYDITVDGGAAANYSFSYVKGKLTIKAKTPNTGDEVSIQDSGSGTQISGKVTGSETDSETGKTTYELTLTGLPESVLNGTTSLADDDMTIEYKGNTYQVKKVESDAFEGQKPGVIIFLPEGVSTTAPVTNVVNGDGTSTELNLNNVTSFVAPRTVHADKVTYQRSTAAGFFTLCLPYDFELPEGYTAWTLNKGVDGVAEFQAGGREVKAGEPYVVGVDNADKARKVTRAASSIDLSAENVTIAATTSDRSVLRDDVEMFGTIAGLSLTKGAELKALVIQPDFSWKMAPLTSEMYVPAFECYLVVKGDMASTIAEGGSIPSSFGDATGIWGIKTDGLDDGDWYNLDGSKLEGKPRAKGMYIHNGRKVVVK